jgi:hypothetical protein
MGEHDILHLRGITALKHKRDLLTAHDLPALVGTAERIDPGARTLRPGIRQAGDEQGSAGVLGRDFAEKFVIPGKRFRVPL